MLKHHHSQILTAYLQRLHWSQLQSITDQVRKCNHTQALGFQHQIRASITLESLVSNAIDSIGDLTELESILDHINEFKSDYN